MMKSVMKVQRTYRLLFNGSLFTFVFALDRVTKWWALQNLAQGAMNFAPGIRLTLTYNRGISWGMFGTISPAVLTFFIAFVIAVFGMYTMRRYRQGMGFSSEILVLAGALSNFVDRFVYGAVIDFIDLYIFSWHWPTIFNIADVAIVLGVCLVIGRVLFYGYDDGISTSMS